MGVTKMKKRGILVLVLSLAACSEQIEKMGEIPAPAVGTPETTPLDTYVKTPDPSYSYRLVQTLEGQGFVAPVLEMISQRPELADSIPGTKTYLCVEAAYGASHEGALHIDDVLTRRTRISIEVFDRGTMAAERVAQEMGEVLGWDADRRRREVEHYLLRVQAERDSQQQPDDQSADAARLGAPDLRSSGAETPANVVRLIGASESAESDSG